ncbi:MAG TPA: PQQ-binding-like beta-propeller repeat protein, partial [Phenylobacterium sp.]|nr:PQQ-binding-like beta-propeller repeat protein [Phenylobacterium sp.]
MAIALFGVGSAAGAPAKAPNLGDWPAYGGGPPGDRYSTLTQIDPSNVGRLTEAWRFDTGPGGLQTQPLVVDGRLYGVTPHQEVFALDGATGRLIWRYEPEPRGLQPVRGLTYWRKGGVARLFTSNASYLTAIDPGTGKPVPEFGHGGSIDLREGLGRPASEAPAWLTTPGVIFGDLIIVGFRTGETHPAAPGAVRAYDVRTGALAWTFDLIPKPGQYGHETWPDDAWRTAGGANNWTGMVVDPRRGVVYVPTGSAVDDFYGADRHGDNLFANSLVALDARTGKRLWHFQAVHHDMLDRDLPSPPVLLTVTHAGRRVDAIAQPTKQGVLFLLDRVTGKPLFPVEERAIPASDTPGEQSSPTQPFPLKPAPFARQRLTEEMLTTRTPQANAEARAAFAKLRSLGPFGPLSATQQTVVFPGFDGGAEWGGSAVDRARGVIYIN